MEVVMLEHYFIKPATIDRIRANWLGPHIEQYVEWLNSEGYHSKAPGYTACVSAHGGSSAFGSRRGH